MTRIVAMAALLCGTAGTALAGGIDRSGQPIAVLFEEGNYAELSFGYTDPELSGEDLIVPQSIGNVAGDFFSPGFGVKLQPTERLSFAILGMEDFGSDIDYPGDPSASALGGTVARSNSFAVTLLGRYKFTENWSAHGGLRINRADGEIKLNGLAYGGPTGFDPLTGMFTGTGGVSGYEVDLAADTSVGYVIGGAYERPDIALRISLTYHSKIRHEFGTVETVALDLNGDGVADATTEIDSADTNVDTPQAINLEFQTGIAPETLLFGGVRWAEWSEFRITPEVYGENVNEEGLVDLNDAVTYSLGVGRRFTDRFSASASVIYEGTTDRLVSPLAPTDGLTAVALGASYRWEKLELSGGVRYAWLGDADPETGTPDTARAEFRDNDAVSVGVRIGYFF